MHRPSNSSSDQLSLCNVNGVNKHENNYIGYMIILLMKNGSCWTVMMDDMSSESRYGGRAS